MSRLRDGMLALGRHEFGYRVELRTRDEFQDLGATLNDISRQLDVASIVQSGFFPEVLPQRDSWRIAASSMPCDATGGDYYDAFELEDGRVAVLVADVSGHGLGPSLIMAGCRSALRALCHADPDPATIVGDLDALMADDLKAGQFITMIFGLLEPDGQFSFANAGHGPALALIDGEIVTLESHTAPLGLGLAAGETSLQTTVRLGAGDRVFLASDGVNEAMSPEGTMFGLAPVRSLLADTSLTADDIVLQLTEMLSVHCRGRSRTDDVTMLCVDRAIRGDEGQ